MTTSNGQLTWDVFVAAPEPMLNPDMAPGETQAHWSPIAATLISGERDAILVDALMTVGQAIALAGWVDAHHKNLTTIYITHAHPDHWYGLGTLLEHFPGARGVALPAVVERMRQASTPEARALPDAILPGKIPARLVIAEPLPEGRLDLEGHEVIAVESGHTDTDDTTFLHVPDLGLIVAGDAIYNDVHQYLAESDHAARLAWLAAVDKIAERHPRAIIAGHQRAGRHDGPEIIEETRRYLRDFDRIAEAAGTDRELYERMLELYPERMNVGALWYSARATRLAGSTANSKAGT